ncbi:MAG: hypothetical protein COT80_00005 [Candidatus Buchananbacteria bacterium CG10_big_fil_rev_8_21_14_0_10_33_19]|uniref:MPN domain-containing protein n=1 Tax=Candidatus Buchananbacteria bacterium CG10_big_fil_rev_8_21_14_0_10_33_19 TaxID=1974525 RepID=A0A2H0W5E0_9BACT|nr:MAG: hypothetical protein COT80_00005 [Candidatus Buchananbacteria bacterium CG10_big_fil_rev_8_21_14_0_10_33_19]
MAKIKDIPKIDRPREKLAKYGPGKLEDEELLAIILGSGTKGLNVRALAKRILKKNRKKLDTLTLEDLKSEKGLGTAKAAQIIAVIELGKRFFDNKKSKLILSPEEVWSRCEDIRSSKKEHFVVFFLDTQNNEIKREIISIGTLNTSLVHPREVFEPAIKANAASIILAHNHPSGSTEPSEEDLEVTKRLKEAGTLLGVKILDHVIVAKSEYRSILA